MDASCYPAADNSFGPSISCSHAFDFTLVFEQSILSIGPSVLFLLLVPWRVWNLYGKSIKTTRIADQALWLKLTIAVSLTGIQVATLILWIRDHGSTLRTAIPAVALSLLGALFGIHRTQSLRPPIVTAKCVPAAIYSVRLSSSSDIILETVYPVITCRDGYCYGQIKNIENSPTACFKIPILSSCLFGLVACLAVMAL